MWKPLDTRDNIAYYGLYVAMIGLPILYITIGIGVAAKIYYRKKLRFPIVQLQNGVEKIQQNNLDFHIEYGGDDELGSVMLIPWKKCAENFGKRIKHCGNLYNKENY